MHRTRLLAIGALFLAAACSSDSPATTTALPGITADVATFAAEGIAEDVDVMAGMDGLTGYLAPSSLDGLFMSPPIGNPNTAGCTRANGHITCPPITRDGMTVNRTVTFLDANGATQTDFDAATTASIHIVSSVSGDQSHEGWTGSISRSHDITISGLAGTETTRTTNGSGSESITRSGTSAAGEARSYSLTGSSTIASVVVPVRAQGVDPWPLSGTISRTYTVTVTGGPNGGHTETRTVIVTFNGTSTPDATVNGDPYTIDLAHRRATARH